LAGAAHVLRALANLPLAIGTVAVPIWVSWVVFPLAGLAAGWLMRHGLEPEAHGPPLPPWERLGGCHPATLVRESQDTARPYCSILASYHFVSEDDEAEP
jgi:hypothetical protein